VLNPLRRRSSPTRPSAGRNFSVVLLVALGLIGGLLTACSGSSKSASNPPASTTTTTAPPPQLAVTRPNIVFVLTDDLSWNLVQYMPHVLQMEKDGATFSHYFVTDSLCCPSRTSIFTGEFPHDSGVFTNTGNDGGFGTFLRKADTLRTFALTLHNAGYATAMMGKYLNGYAPESTALAPRGYVPAGWSEWDVAGNGYPEFDYYLGQDHALVHYGKKPRAYLTDVLSRLGTAFIAKSAAAHQPFLLEEATFAPHGPYVPAPRDANDFPGLKAPRTPAFNTADTVGKPAWLDPYPRIGTKGIATIDSDFRKRAQTVQAVDRMIGNLEQAVAARGLTKSTYFVFSSDNGFHLGEHRMGPGKQTAFDTDIRVPLVVVGPGVEPGQKIDNLAENIDLSPTFEQLAGVRVPKYVDGTSLVSLLLGEPVSAWRKGVLVEHHGPDTDTSDPDFQPRHDGNPPSYEALRQPNSVYVEYADGEHEYYDTLTDPNELRNIYQSLSTSTKAALHKQLMALRLCHGGAACHEAQLLKTTG
jgi:N-acetylglucosamine-6-sulfatase